MQTNGITAVTPRPRSHQETIFQKCFANVLCFILHAIAGHLHAVRNIAKMFEKKTLPFQHKKLLQTY